MNHRKKNEEIVRAAKNSQVIHKGNVTLLVIQSTCYKSAMLFSMGMCGALFVPRGQNVAKAVANAAERIQSGALSKYEGAYQSELKKSLSQLQAQR